uniref:Uncharacterized protein n=1 Tax=Helianthus annuus TaxID=4232 RepID=A0A251SR43_HELAN
MFSQGCISKTKHGWNRRTMKSRSSHANALIISGCDRTGHRGLYHHVTWDCYEETCGVAVAQDRAGDNYAEFGYM